MYLSRRWLVTVMLVLAGGFFPPAATRKTCGTLDLDSLVRVRGFNGRASLARKVLSSADLVEVQIPDQERIDCEMKV